MTAMLRSTASEISSCSVAVRDLVVPQPVSIANNASNGPPIVNRHRSQSTHGAEYNGTSTRAKGRFLPRRVCVKGSGVVFGQNACHVVVFSTENDSRPVPRARCAAPVGLPPCCCYTRGRKGLGVCRKSRSGSSPKRTAAWALPAGTAARRGNTGRLPNRSRRKFCRRGVDGRVRERTPAPGRSRGAGRIGPGCRYTFLAAAVRRRNGFLRRAKAGYCSFSAEPGLLNLPWELLPGRDGRFLVADGRWAIRRAVRPELAGHRPAAGPSSPADPVHGLRTQHAGLPVLDYEREEEAILRIADRLGGKIFLDIAEAGTFDELRDLISEVRPHVVHLSGHGALADGVGRFCFEDERGRLDARDGPEMAECLFAGSGVRLVFVSGCQIRASGRGGVVPKPDGGRTRAAGHRLGRQHRRRPGDRVCPRSVSRAGRGPRRGSRGRAARRNLLDQGRVRIGGQDALDASFALPQVYASAGIDRLLDESQPPQRPERPGVRYELLGDDIRGLRTGFVGRRRVLQRTRPALRGGEKTVVLLTGIGGVGKSTLATRLANRCKQDGWRVVALQARREEAGLFCLRLLDELAAACQRLGREGDERMLRDGRRPIAERLRLAVEVLNEMPHPAGVG